MIVNGQIGILGSGTQSLGAGTSAPLRQGNMGDAIVSELHGRDYEATYRRTMYSASNAAGVTTTVGLATTYTGLCLTNPIGSGWNLILRKVGLAAIVAFPAASILGIMAGYNGGTAVTQTTPITPTANYVGAAVGVGLAASSVTLPTAPTLRQILGAGLTGAITVQTTQFQYWDLDGSIILPPGAYAAIFTSTVSGTSGLAASFTWEEVPNP